MKPSKPHHRIYIITGKVHSGKTTFLGKLATRLKQEQIHMTGFLSVGTFKKRQRDSFTLVSLADGTRQALASVEKREEWIRFGRFYFNPDALRKGERIIRRGLEMRADLLILDEVGPFELEGGGWSGVLKLLVNEHEIAQIWVVRDQVLEQVLDRWNIPEKNVFRVNPDEEERIIQTIIQHVRINEIGPAI